MLASIGLFRADNGHTIEYWKFSTATSTENVYKTQLIYVKQFYFA